MIDNFECVNCGICCETLEAVRDEKTRLYILPCTHYNTETKLCDIYEDRPYICKNVPDNIKCITRTGCKGKINEKEEKKKTKIKKN